MSNQPPDPLSAADVARIAALARLELTGEESALFARQLADVLAYADQLQRIDTTGVEATAHVRALVTAEREDALRPSLSMADAVANAPDGETDAGFFRVPRVIGG